MTHVPGLAGPCIGVLTRHPQPIHDPAGFCQVQTAYAIIVWFCATINICFLIVNIRLMVCRWFDVKEEQQRHAMKAALINQREARKELQRAEELIKWENVS